MPSTLLDNVISDITKATTVQDSAIAFINGVPGLIDAAVAAAIANGATEAELQPVSDLSDQLQAKSDALEAAIVANTH